MAKSKTIVFTHGLFVNPTSWENWKAYFEARGYKVYTPANPGHEGKPADLRKNPPSELGKVGFEDVVTNVVKLIDTLPEKPIVIGHSLGGLTTMKLIELGKAVAGVSIDGAAPKNILPPLQTVRMVFPVLNFFKGNSPFETNKAWFHKGFGNNLSRQESDKVFEQIAVPESRNIPRDTLYRSFTKIDMKQPHAPLLFIGGGNDAIIPPSLTRRIAGAYKDAKSTTDLKVFEGRSHYICGEEGWEEVAEYVLNWMEQL